VFISCHVARRGPLLRALRPREALARLQASQAYATQQPSWRTFAQRMRTIPAFEIRRGPQPSDTVAELQDLLARLAVRRRPS
jgi:hypothetical protein